jgi:lysozyme family protein
MESGFNFGRHLHNGDLLAHRTTRVPAGRPPVEVADPPFAWTTSAIDALSFMNLHKVTEWTLPRILYELERYNGFGYRFRGLATPYLWSFSDRCGRGRFIKDGVFDPDAESKQSGAATLLKRMIERQQIRL